MFGASRYFAMKRKAEKLPHVTVSREEFIRLMMEHNGDGDRERAELSAKVAEGMGASAMIGEQLVSIQKEE